MNPFRVSAAPGTPIVGVAARKLIAIYLNAKFSSHHRPILKRLERFERLGRLEPGWSHRRRRRK